MLNVQQYLSKKRFSNNVKRKRIKKALIDQNNESDMNLELSNQSLKVAAHRHGGRNHHFCLHTLHVPRFFVPQFGEEEEKVKERGAKLPTFPSPGFTPLGGCAESSQIQRKDRHFRFPLPTSWVFSPLILPLEGFLLQNGRGKCGRIGRGRWVLGKEAAKATSTKVSGLRWIDVAHK